MNAQTPNASVRVAQWDILTRPELVDRLNAALDDLHAESEKRADPLADAGCRMTTLRAAMHVTAILRAFRLGDALYGRGA